MGLLPEIKTKKRKGTPEPNGFILFRGAVFLAIGITAISAIFTDFDPTPKMVFVIIGILCCIFGLISIFQYTKAYKAFKRFIPKWDAGRGMYDKFAEELNAWYQTGQKPECCDGDTSYHLKLQQERLKGKGIRMHNSITPIKGTSYGTATVSRKSLWYTTDMSYESIYRKIAFSNAGGTLYERELGQTMYEIIAHTPNDAETEKISLTCPNCGFLSPVKALEDGCPYCDTKFRITDLFPRVVNLYFIKNNASPNTSLFIQKTITACMAVIFLIFATISVIGTHSLQDIPAGLAMTFFATLFIGGGLGYLLSSILMFAGLFDRDGIKPMSPIKWARTKRQITNTLKRYNPSFSYDKFEGQLVSLIRMAVFAQNPETLACYRSTKRDPRFSDILEMTYTNGTVLKNVKRDGNRIILFLRTWWINYSEVKGQIKKTGDCIDVVLSRDITQKEIPGFSITSVQCAGCGGSFDAVRQKICPYCGNEYHMEKENWVIESMELVR